jgi:hypothetical protein
MKSGATLRVLWTLLSLGSAFFVLGLVLGDAAWNGVNFALGLYLVLSVGGLLGILGGFFSVFSHRRVYEWITCAGSATIAGLSAIFAFGFIFSRARGTPLNGPIIIGGVQVPLLLFYGWACLCCAIEAALFYPRVRKL